MGCGNGFITLQLARQLEGEVLAIDSDVWPLSRTLNKLQTAYKVPHAPARTTGGDSQGPALDSPPGLQLCARA